MLSAKQIEIFYEVYRTSSMTAAAKRLQISQPSISKTLGVIEKNLNFKLFLRKGKKLIPTMEADDLYEHINNKYNLGYERSLLKGFRYVKNNHKNCKYILTMDADGEHQPKFINNLIKKRYKNLFNKIDKLVYLKVPHYNYIIIILLS